MTPPTTETGFTLLEALIAATLLATAIASISHMVTIAATQASNNRHSLIALVAAQSKLEELRAREWTADLSPARTLVEDIGGFVDYPHTSGLIYVRRWAISPLALSDPNTLVVEVCVFRRQSSAQALRPEACVAGTRTKRP